MEGVWSDAISGENLFATIEKIKFSERQNEMIAGLVENAFFYEEKEQPVAGRVGGAA